MKIKSLMIAALLAISPMAAAQSVEISQASAKAAVCLNMGELAVTVMEARQSGMSRKEIDAKLAKTTIPFVRTRLASMIEDAYTNYQRVPREDQQSLRLRFQVEHIDQCMWAIAAHDFQARR